MEKQIIKTTDWLTRGYSEEELARMKEVALKEAEAELQKKQIEEMARILNKVNGLDDAPAWYNDFIPDAEALYNAGYRKQSEEELIDKIATYFEKEENWDELKHGVWLACGRSHELRRMLRESLRD